VAVRSRHSRPAPSARRRHAWPRWTRSAPPWLKGEVPTAELNGKNWIALEWIHFLNSIDGKANAAQMAELDQSFGLAKSGNNEIAFRFYLASIKAGYNDMREPLNAFLMSVGRQKFVVPLYGALLKNPADKDWAKSVYAKARDRYHPVTQASVDKQCKK
jgi:leukotriene-A4 hydrolase